MIPSPCRTELLIRAGKARDDYVQRLSSTSSFAVIAFDRRAATESDLDSVYNTLLSQIVTSANRAKSVIELLFYEAGECLKAADGINFEHKIVSAIAIRLVAEKFMIEKISDSVFLASINSNQTPKLLKKFRELFVLEKDAISVVQQVTLMTPENIHLNSSMYEPFLDMSDEHLRRLYREVADL